MEAMHVAAPAPMDESNAAKENLVQPHEERTYTDRIFEQHEKRKKKESRKTVKDPKKSAQTKAKLSKGKANGVPATPPSTPAAIVNHKARAPGSVSPHKRLSREQQDSVDRLSKPSPRLSTKTVYAHRYHRTAQTVPIAVTPVIGTLNDLYQKIAESVHPPLLNPVQHVYTEEGDRIDNVLDLANGQHIYYVCAGDFVPSKQPKTKRARNAALQREREVVSRVSSPVKKPVRKITMKRKYRKDVEQNMKTQGIRDPHASMDIVILNKFSTVDELIYSINKTSPVQVVAIYDLTGRKKEYLDQFDDGETVWMQLRGDPPITSLERSEKKKKKKLSTGTKKVSSIKKKKKKATLSPVVAIAKPALLDRSSDDGSRQGEVSPETALSSESEVPEEDEEAGVQMQDVLSPSPVHLVWDRVDSQQPSPVALHLDAEGKLLEDGNSLDGDAAEKLPESPAESGQPVQEDTESETKASTFPTAKVATAGVVGAAVGGGVAAATISSGQSPVQPGIDVASGEHAIPEDLSRGDKLGQPTSTAVPPSDDSAGAKAEGNGKPAVPDEELYQEFRPLEAFDEDTATADIGTVEDEAASPGVDEEPVQIGEDAQASSPAELDVPAVEEEPADMEAEMDSKQKVADAAIQESTEDVETEESKDAVAAKSAGLLAGGAVGVGAGVGAGVGVAQAVKPSSHPGPEFDVDAAGEQATPMKSDAAADNLPAPGNEEEIFFTPAGKEEEGMQTPVIGPSAEQEDNEPSQIQELDTEPAEKAVSVEHEVTSEEVSPDTEVKPSDAVAELTVLSEANEEAGSKPAKKGKKSKSKSKTSEASGKKGQKGEKKKKKGGLFSCSCFGGGK
uniref:Doublecortin domain-containing protein n=1 Tax=Picocystis salinarum TaxID=88271 RepID=A0A6U9QYR9_9CHLO